MRQAHLAHSSNSHENMGAVSEQRSNFLGYGANCIVDVFVHDGMVATLPNMVG